MSDPGNSSFDLEPSCSNTIILANNEKKVNVSEIIKTRNYRPAPASKKRKREEENDKLNNMELLNVCKPLSIKLQRLPQQIISKMMKKCDQACRTKRRRRWRNGFADKLKKKPKTEKKSEIFRKPEKLEISEKSLESNEISNLSSMVPTHAWGCCRMIPFERNQSRGHRKFSLNRNRESIGSGSSQKEVPKDKILELSTSKVLLRERQLHQEDKLSSSKATENDAALDIPQNRNSHSTHSLPVQERKCSIPKEGSTSKPVEDEFVCRRTIPYIRKTKCMPVLNLEINNTAQTGSSKNSIPGSKSVQNQEHNLNEPKPKSAKSSSERETRISETEKFSDCKNRFRQKDKNLQKSNIVTFDTCEIPSQLQSKVCEKTDETKAPEPNDSKETDTDENMEDNNFAWNSSSMWKYKRKHRSRRISSSSSSEASGPQKKRKISTTLDTGLTERRPGPSSTHGRIKSHSAHSAIRTLCPPSCTNTEHHSGFFNFLYQKSKEIHLKEGRVLLERLDDMVNDPDVIRWRNSLIKLEMEEVEEEVEEDSEEHLDDSRYYVMYENGTVPSETLSQAAIYQIREMTEFDPMDESCQAYEKVNPDEGQLISTSILDVPINCNYTEDETKHLEDHMHQAALPKDVTLIDDNLLRDDDDDVPLEFSEYPKILLIRLEKLVGFLETEYSASEIENLEDKYIDFIMNSNFSYDKQSQSFFEVYKHLHAKRAEERELEALSTDRPFYADEDVAELHEMDESNSRDDFIEEKPLVIALDAEKEDHRIEEWTSKENSSINVSADNQVFSTDTNFEIATITPLAKDATQSNLSPFNGINEIISEAFATCDKISEEQVSKEELLYITCKFCKESFKNLHSFSLHKTDCYTKNKKPLKCEYCHHQYKCRRTLKLHIHLVHRQEESVNEKQKTSIMASEKTSTKTNEKTSSSANDKTNSSGPKNRKVIRPAAEQSLFCGVCSVEFSSKESLWDHILKHTEQELQDAYKDATKNNKNPEFQDKLRRIDERKKEKQLENCQNKNQSKKNSESRIVARQSAQKNQYAQWKDRILYKNSSNDKANKNATCRGTIPNETEEIILSSSESDNCEESNKDCENIDNNSSTSRSSVVRNTKSIRDETEISTQVVTMCPCHRLDTSTMVNGDMQIEMVLLCKICQVLFRRLDCFEVHYRVNRLCNMDRRSRLPKLFCSYCRIILDSLPEMRSHLEKHAKVNHQGHVTFLCNICKVMFFGVGSLFYSHWFNHNKDVNFVASRYSFPKVSIVQIVSKTGQNQKEDYVFVAEYVCKYCKIPFGSEVELEKHVCNKTPAPVPIIVPISEPKDTPEQPKLNIPVRVSCTKCQKIFANKVEYDSHEKIHNHLNSTKPEFICVSSNINENAYICTQCKTVRISIEDFKDHWILHRQWRERFTCAHCPDVCSSNFEEIESHCQRCFKKTYAVCLVSLISADYHCQPCNLNFETGIEWKEHRQMCKLPASVYKAYVRNGSSYEPIIQSDLLSASSAVSPTVTTTSPTVVSSTASVSSSNNTFISILPKPTSTQPKVTSSSLLEKYLKLCSPSKQKSKSKCHVSEDTEVIEILSESSSRSSVTEVSKDTSSVTEIARKNNPVLNANDQFSTLKDNEFDLYTPGNLQSEYRRKDISLSKAVVCYPPKRKESKRKQQLIARNDPSTTSQISTNVQKNTIREDAERAKVMTAVNPEFESLLSELEGLECNIDSPKSSLRNVRKKSTLKECNLETFLLNTPRTGNSSATRDSVEEDACTSVVSEITSSSKYAEKETVSPLPFEVVLLPEDEAASPKPGAVSQTSTSQVDVNSSKLANSASDENPIHKKITNRENTASVKDVPTEPNTTSIIEEYIEFNVMDEAATDKPTAQEKSAIPANLAPTEATAKVEKVAPTRLRVRTLAELQEIKMHLCDTCGQSFDAKKSFDEHARENNCERVQPTHSVKAPPVRLSYKGESSQDPMPSMGRTSIEINYERALRQNLVRRGVHPANMDYVPPLLPLPIQQLNASTSKANMTPVSPNLAIPDPKRRQSQPFRSQQTYSSNTGVITPSNISRFNNSASHSIPRSGAIQLPERTGVNVLQKRPSGAATRIQNLSHPQKSPTSSVIQHRGLPQTYSNKQTGRLNHLLSTQTKPPPPYPSSGSTGSTGSTSIRPAPENHNSLNFTTCNNFTAKSLPEYSDHLVMHYEDSSKDPENQAVNVNDLRNEESQSIDSALRDTPNTSGYQTSPTAASEVYSGRSTAVTGDWQTPARYIYACQLCDFRTESKASIRLHEKNHSTVAVMRQKNLQRLQNHQIQQAYQVQQQRQRPTLPQITPTLSQLMKSHKQNQRNVESSAEQSAGIYNRVSGDIIECQLCNNYPFSTPEEFNRHVELSHKEIRKETDKESTDKSAIFFVCDYCETPQIFESEVELRKHMNFLHNHLCPICSQRCTSRERLQSHMLRHE